MILGRGNKKKKGWPKKKGYILGLAEDPVLEGGEVPGAVPADIVDMSIEQHEAVQKDPAPVPPAAVDSWANPIDAGEERNTEYTFF